MLATISISEFLVESAIDAPYDEKLTDFVRVLGERRRAPTATGVARAPRRAPDAALRSPRPHLLSRCAIPTASVVAGEHADGTPSRWCSPPAVPMLQNGQVGEEPVRVAALQIADPRDAARDG